jgi:hypothetical protein
MAEDFPHLALQRETPVTDKRRSQPPRFNTPDDVRGHSLGLLEKLTNARVQCEGDEGGFDDRKLIKFSVDKGFNPDDLQKISPTIEFVSQEQETVVIGFVSDAAPVPIRKVVRSGCLNCAPLCSLHQFEP